jgi:hypothetical protein
MAQYTSDVLIASIKRLGSIPTTQNLIKQADFLALINEQLQSKLVPMLMKVREEYFGADFDYTIVAGQSTYRIPQRAIGGKLRDVQYVTSSYASSLPRIDESEITSSSSLRGFAIAGNSVLLSPTPQSSTDKLRLKHYRRPNTVTDVSSAGQIQSINLSTNQVTCLTVPTTFATGVLCDMVKAQAGFECLQIDSAITNISGSTITFASLPTDIAVGDFITIATESPLPQIPQELHPVLAQMVVVKCLEALSDSEGLQNAKANLNESMKEVMDLIAPRVDGAQKKIKSNNSIVGSYRRGLTNRWTR